MLNPAPPIEDWNDEYDNVGHIPNALNYITVWREHAEAFRESLGKEESAARIESDVQYGKKERQVLDIFFPEATSKLQGLLIFVHGGYWYRFDKSDFSHLARGPLANGYAVAMPSYSLCPQVTITEITLEITAAIQFAAQHERLSCVEKIVLCGHSAGGHLVTRQICEDSILDPAILSKITNVISISGVHDLRPILRIVQNETIRLAPDDAHKESPALQIPFTGIPMLALVGSLERPEFIRQSDLLANIWRGMGVATKSIHVPSKHHFDIIEDLLDPKGLICSALAKVDGP